MVADSLDGVWNNSPSIGAGLGVGLLLGILSSGSGSTEYVERVNTSPSTENFKFGDSSGICVGSSSPDFGQREPVNKYGESPR